MLVHTTFHPAGSLEIKLTDSLYKVLELFEEFQVSHLPVVSEKNKYLGLICQKDVFDVYDESKNVGENNHPFLRLSIFEHTHVFETIALFGNTKLSLLPVINNQEKYLGYILPIDVLEGLTQHTSIQEQGSLLVLKIYNRDYSLNEISRLLEADGFQIISLFLEYLQDENSTLVHLKLNKDSIGRAIRIFERFNYEIFFVDKNNQEDDHDVDTYQSLMKYLHP